MMTREEAYRQGLTECDRYYINLIERRQKEKKLEEYESLGDIKELIHIDRALEII